MLPDVEGKTKKAFSIDTIAEEHKSLYSLKSTKMVYTSAATNNSEIRHYNVVKNYMQTNDLLYSLDYSLLSNPYYAEYFSTFDEYFSIHLYEKVSITFVPLIVYTQLGPLFKSISKSSLSTVVFEHFTLDGSCFHY